jgi:ABC-2 type transport system ATP-binding protein
LFSIQAFRELVIESDHIPAIEVSRVTKKFKEVTAVDDLTISIRQGEFVALLGPNGAGKTTLIEMIEGLQPPTSGEIKVFGLHWKGNEDYLHHQLGISLQETRFIDKLRVHETLSLFASFYGLEIGRIDEVLAMIALEEKKRSYVVNLSGGQRQRLALGIGLLNRPRLLLLDEPTTGLDPTSRREIWNILLNLKQKEKTTMILTSHYMEEASFLCERIIILDKGRIIAKGSLDDLLAHHDKGEIIEFSTSCLVNPDQLSKVNGVRSIHKINNGKQRLIVDSIIDVLPRLLNEMDDLKCGLLSLECRKFTLDDLFVSLTGRTLND